ncbi:type II secretion system F family protein [Brucepastera parasyntrophica]|uniref:type II secretion system F family protein n=1 Tax=Brucepastera parasyntrophica TaxID=2880008 RepID=UPI00210994F5|nr:type II secretion system F family protein [Brucepastera parasyntrophica]ULQ59088.1 type II secretion system F family protein [Brucepastera parasyntrophica]
MPSYRCLVCLENGKTETRVISADDENEAVRSFAGTPVMLISITRATEPESSKKGRKARKAVLEFTEMMELLVDSGLSLKDALELLANMNKKAKPSLLASRLMELIDKGSSFAQAVQASSDVFPSIYRGMVKVGDRVGSVERIFPQLSSYLKNQKNLKDKIVGSLIYPLFILAVTLFGIIWLVFFIIPRMEIIFSGFGGNAAEQVHANIETMKIVFSIIGIFILLACAAVLVLKLLSRKNAKLALAIDSRVLKIPFVGGFISSWETHNFTFAMETLSAGGVSVEAAIQEAADVVSNTAYKQALLDVKKKVLKGISLSSAFTEHSEFPAYMSQWISIGERAGKTEKIFSQIRSYFQDEIENKTARILALVEPGMIVIIGVLLVTLIIGIIVPIFSMYGSLL